MVILIDGVRYVMTAPESELALAEIIEKNYQHIFGEDSFYFNLKRQITSGSGIGSIPDAYAIVFDTHPRWCILEVELALHPLYEHIVTQLTKFNRGIENSASRKKIIDMLYDAIKEDPILEVRVTQKIGSGEIYKFVSELISSSPTIIVVIDKRTKDLEEAVKDIRGDVRILEFKIFKREGISEDINAYLFTPVVSKKIKKAERGEIIRTTKVSKAKVVLPRGMKLQKTYKGKKFIAEVIEDQKIRFNGEIYNSVSRAAVAAIRSTGSKRTTEDGWRWWTYTDPESGEQKSIDTLRKK